MSRKSRIPAKGPTFQDDVIAVMRDLASGPFVTGNHLENVDLTTTETAVLHGLGKAPRGYLVLGKIGPGDVWMSQAPDSRHLFLLSDTTVTVDLWVF